MSKICKNCSCSIESDTEFCPSCGTFFSTKENLQDDTSANTSTPAENTLPMKWYKFLINFKLFFDSFLLFLPSIYLIWFKKTETLAFNVAKEVYLVATDTVEKILPYDYLDFRLCEKTLEITDFIFWSSLPFIGFGIVLLIIARIKLASFSKNATLFLFLSQIYIIMIFSAFSFYITHSTLPYLSEWQYLQAMFDFLFLGAIYLISNYNYFKNRKHLFND